MLKRWAAWPPGIRWLAGIAAVVLAAAIVWAVFVPVPDWLARHDVGSAKPALVQTARDAARGRLLTLAAGLFAAGALAFTALNFSLSRRTFELTEQGQVTDRFTKAIEQLGSDKLDVRIGGIYALERVARDSAKDHPTVMEVLTAFIREHSRELWPPPDTGSRGRTAAAPRALSSTTRTRGPARTVHYLAARSSSSTSNPPEQERVTRPDIQAAATVIGRLHRDHDRQPIDLTGAHLSGANLTGAHLTGADLDGADLTHAQLFGANLTGADLTDAQLFDANLTGAYLSLADLTRADLTDANLFGAQLFGAKLTRAQLLGAHLADAHLTRVNLERANLERADLSLADLSLADLTDANLTGANLGGANLGGARFDEANLTDARWPTAEPAPQGWMIDGDSGRLKRAGRLSEVIVHYL